MSVMKCITRGSADRSGDFQHEKIERILFSRELLGECGSHSERKTCSISKGLVIDGGTSSK
jgi:hypothetical protein